MPEYEVTLVWHADYDDTADAFEFGDLVATAAEHEHPDLAIDVKLRELNP